jgi:hypothetical protein
MNHIQLHHNVKHKLFDKQQAAQHTLSIYIGKDEISYCIINDANNMVVVLKSFRLTDVNNFFTYKLAVNDFFEQEEWLKLGYSRINIAINAAPYTVVPEKYFDSSKVEKYFAYNHPYEGGGKLHSDYLESVRAYLIYSVDYYLLDVLEKNFVMFRLQHSNTALLAQINADLIANNKNNAKTLHINIQKYHIDLIGLLGNTNLRLITSNYIESPNDLLYYTLNAAKEIGLDLQTDQVVLTGDISTDYPHYKLCQKYVPQLTLGKRPTTLQYCSETDILPANSHYNLWAIK